MTTRRLVASLLLLASVALSADAQQYRNLSNRRFATIASGPMHAVIVDVPDPNNRDAVRRLVAEQMRRLTETRARMLAREVEILKRTYPNAREYALCIPEVVMLRKNSRLVLDAPTGRTRAGNEITIAFPASGTPGAWSAQRQIDLQNIYNAVYPELKRLYGEPFWNATITVINGDNLPPGQIISDPNAFSGGVLNVSTKELIFAQYRTAQTAVLNLTQALLLAFRGPAGISYDAWERGMARAVTQMAVTNVLPILRGIPAVGHEGTSLGDIDLTDAFFHALDRYDVLNQPALGNDRFFPVSKVNGQANTSGFPRMLYQRLQMAGSAWLKVGTTAPDFFAAFNARYYTQVATAQNSVPALRQIARQALEASTGTDSVEGMPFGEWYERQYVLDTSVTQGFKLYSQVVPLRPDASRPPPQNDDFGVALFLSYYRTTFDASGNSDELNVNGTGYPIYWDYTFTSRLFLGAQYERFDIGSDIAGEGSLAPGFFNTLGGDPGLESRMRITIDLPVQGESLRLWLAPRNSGTQQQPNNFWGVVVGADTGVVRIVADGIDSGDVPVRQGAFGASVNPALFSRPRRATVTFTPDGGTPVTRTVVTGYREYVAVLQANAGLDSRTFTFTESPALVSFPIRPLRQKATEVLLGTDDLPLFNDNTLLLAQWRQSLPGDDKYLKYPDLEPITPGKGYWAGFPVPITVKIVGQLPEREPRTSVSLLFGWNQIGTPYQTALNINDLEFQFGPDNQGVDLQTAITKGWIEAVNLPAPVGQVAVYQFGAGGYSKATTLEPWKGYFIKVRVAEGLTLTYTPPSTRQAAQQRRSSVQPPASGWVLPVVLRTKGRSASVYIGQAEGASAGFDRGLDGPKPPAVSRMVPDLSIVRMDWGADSGEYFSDIQPLGARTAWELTALCPDPEATYTLSWPDLNQVPRNVRLVLHDLATGTRRYLDSSSGYTFAPGGSPTRRFRIEAENRSRAALRILHLTARPNRSSGALQIGFELTQGASVSATVRGGSGSLVRKIVQGRAAGQGSTALLWDSRDENGIAVPAGTYLLEVTAVSENGEVARVVQPVILVR